MQAQQVTMLLHEFEAHIADSQVDEACALISEPVNVKLRVVFKERKKPVICRCQGRHNLLDV